MGAIPKSWSSVLQRNAHCFPHKSAYILLSGAGDSEQAVTYSELQRAVFQLGSRLSARLPRQSRVLILLPQNLNFIRAFLACAISGMVAIPMYLPGNSRQISKVQNIFRDAAPHAVLWSPGATPQLYVNLQEHGLCESATWIDVDTVEEGSGLPLEADPDELAMMQYTSGSTGKPKGVILTHRNLLANQRMIHETFEHTDQSVVLGCLPFFHDMGLIGNVLQPLYLGATCVFLSPQQVVRQPLSWLRNIGRFRATTSGGPNGYYELCINRIDRDAHLDDLDLSCWKVAFNGSEPVRQSTLETFAERFAPYGFHSDAFLPVYGLAEASLLVTGLRRTASAQVRTGAVGCGLPAHGVEIAIVGREGRRMDPGEVGEIWVRSDSVAGGYWNAPPEGVFDGKLIDDPEGLPFLRTGDLGFLYEGELFVTGRAKESIIIRGRNYAPADIEATAAASGESLALCRSAAFSVEAAGSEEAVLVQELSAKAAENRSEIRSAILHRCWLEHGVHLLDVVFVRAGTIPRTTSGKTQRLLARRMYLDGSFQRLEIGGSEGEVDRLELNRVRECLLDSLKRHFPNHTIEGCTAISDLGMDSYAVVSLSEEVCQRLGKDVPLIAFVKQSTVDELARHIMECKRAYSFAWDFAVGASGARSEEAFRQSHAQIALWNRERLAQHRSALNVCRAVKVNRRLNEAVIAPMLERCEILRLELQEKSGEFTQRVLPKPRAAVEYVDALEWGEARIAAFLEDRANSVLDIVNGETWRWFVLSRPEGSVVLFVLHHIICDLETVNSLIEMLFGGGDDPVLHYRDFVDWHYHYLGSETAALSAAFWERHLADVDLRIDVVTRKSALSTAGATPEPLVRRWSASDTGELLRKSHEAGVGLNVLLLAAFAVVLKRYTGQRRFAVGVPVSARTHPRFRGVSGYMVNVLPIVVDFTGPYQLSDIVRQVRESIAMALNHQDYPLPLIVQQYRRSRPERLQQFDHLNVVFSHQKASLSNGQDATAFALNASCSRPVTIGNTQLCPIPVKARHIEFPIMLSTGVIEGGLVMQLQWDTGSMYETVMRDLLEEYEGLLTDAVRDWIA